MIKLFFAAIAVIAFLWTPPGKAAEAASVAGRWHFVFDTEGGDRVFNSVFEQNADKVTGKWDVTETKKDGEPVAGTFTQNQLALEFPVNSEEAGPGTLKLKGQIAEDGTLTGTWVFQEYSGTFKATRVKDEAATR